MVLHPCDRENIVSAPIATIEKVKEFVMPLSGVSGE